MSKPWYSRIQESLWMQSSPSSQRVTNDTIATVPKVTGFTMRISNIPSSITEDMFLQVLNGLPYGAPPSGGQQNVLGWSFTLPISSTDAKKSRTATVTFRSIPLNLELALNSTSIDLLGGAIADSNFYGLTPLSDPSGQPIVDIIAVTGLAGHAFGSWKSRGGYKMWLRDFLPEDIPNARILTYGYDSTLLGNNSHASILQFSQQFIQALKLARADIPDKYRPILFIGHSLGGLVIRSALADAQLSDHDGDESIFGSFHSLLLFGVPSKGLNVESLKSMVKGQPNLQLIVDLSESSNFLTIVNKYWGSIPRKSVRIVSVYETKPTRTVQETPTGWKRTGEEVLMVDPDSATYATPKENQNNVFSIDANHSDIVKFGNSTCQDYLNVKSNIMSLVRDLQEKLEERLKEREAYILLRGPNGEKKRDRILRWLSPIEYIKHHENAKEGLLEDTGRWLLVKEQFVEWRSSQVSGILWLHGIPGSGKTKLTCMVIDTLRSQNLNNDINSHQQHEPVVYFYCNRNEPLRRDPTTILQAIVKQLSLLQADVLGLPKVVVAEYDTRVKNGLASGSLGFQESHQLAVSLLSLYPQTTIIIDALDECDPKERWRLLDVLTSIIKSSHSTSLVKVFISSRDDIDITLKLKDRLNLYIDARDNDGDIQRFVNREVAQSIENGLLLCGQVTDELRGLIISTIISKAKGMFQWADLQVKHLCGMNLEEDIKENLGRLPEGLEGAYSQIYTDILSERLHAQNITKKALMWIMCSRRLFTREEWIEAIYWPKEAPKGSVLTLFKLCRNLVVWDSQSDAVRFAHLSVREYLEGKFTSIDTNSMAVGYCLSLFDPTYSILVDHSMSPSREALVRYSTFYWPVHVESSYDDENHMTREILDILQQFLGTPAKPGQSYCRWKETAHKLLEGRGRSLVPEENEIRDALYHLSSTPPNPLFAMSYFRFGEELREHWESNVVDIRSKNSAGETLLLVASMQGNVWVIGFLVGKGAPVNAGRSRYFENPLMAAIKKGQEKAIIKLAAEGASVSANGAYYTDILQAAVYERGKGLVKAIVTRDTTTEITRAAVVEAAAAEAVNVGSGKEIMKLMLARDANTEINGQAVVEIAKRFGTYIMQILLAKDPNIKVSKAVMIAAMNHSTDTEITENVLIEAVSHGKEITRLLLEQSTDIEITEKVLIAAVSHGKEITRFLLEQSTDTEITEKVLIAAVSHGKEITRFLLEQSTDIEITEKVLIAAVSHGKEITRFLLEQSTDTEITEKVLIAAVSHGKEITRFLLEQSTNIEITEKVLIAAVSHGKEITRFLLEQSTDIEITEKVLVAAAKNQEGGQEPIPLLLAKDPNIRITEDVLIVAANYNKEIAQLILEQSTNIEITDKVVTKIASTFDYSVMQILLAKDLDIKISEAVLVAALKNWGYGKDITNMLLRKNPDIKISEAILVAVVERNNGKDIIEILLRENYDIKISEAVLVAALKNWSYGKDIINMLLRNDPSIRISEAFLVAVMERNNGKDIIEMLLWERYDIKISEATLVAVLKRDYGKDIIQMLLRNNPDIKISEATLVAVLKRDYGKDIIQMLLRNNPDIKISEATLVAVLKWDYGKDIIQMLLQENYDIKISEATLVAVLRGGYGKDIIQMLLDKNPDIKITEAVLVEVVANSHYSRNDIQMLLDKNPDIKINEVVLVAAAKNPFISNDIIQMLLSKNTDIKISEAVLLAAAKNPYSSNNMIQILLSKNPDTKISEAVLLAAAKNPYSSNNMIQILLSKNPDTKISEAVLVAAAKNPYSRKDIIQMLLEKGPDIKVSEAVLVAAAKNLESRKGAIQMLLSKNPDIKISEAVLVAAAKNPYSSKDAIQILLEKEPNITISEAVLVAAAENPYSSGRDTIQMLLSKNPDIKVTEAVLVAAAKNPDCNSKDTIKMLLSQKPDIKISKAVVIAAAGNLYYGNEIMQLLLVKNPEPEVVVTAMARTAASEESLK